MSDGLPGNLEHCFSRLDGPALDILDAAVGGPVGDGGGQTEEPRRPSHLRGDWQRPIGQRDDLRDALAFPDLLIEIEATAVVPE